MTKPVPPMRREDSRRLGKELAARTHYAGLDGPETLDTMPSFDRAYPEGDGDNDDEEDDS